MILIRRLRLENGSAFEGRLFGAPDGGVREDVFNTGMVADPDSHSDSSYAGLIPVLRYILICNFGVPAYSRGQFGLPIDFESDPIQAAALLVAVHSDRYSHHRATRSLDGCSPNAVDFNKQASVDLVMNISTHFQKEELINNCIIRLAAADFGVPLITDRQLAEWRAKALYRYPIADLRVRSWNRYAIHSKCDICLRERQ